MKFCRALPIRRFRAVTPRAGVWIEIYLLRSCHILHPVTPRAGVWIEILQNTMNNNTRDVTPRAGVWIEIVVPLGRYRLIRSLPVRECGLKSGNAP